MSKNELQSLCAIHRFLSIYSVPNFDPPIRDYEDQLLVDLYANISIDVLHQNNSFKVSLLDRLSILRIKKPNIYHDVQKGVKAKTKSGYI